MIQLTLTGYHLQGWVTLLRALTVERDSFVSREGLVHLTALGGNKRRVVDAPVDDDDTTQVGIRTVREWASPFGNSHTG